MATFRSYKQTVQEMESFSFIGIGDSSVLRYFTKAFIGPRRKPMLHEATLLAIYMVLWAKVYIEGCGGDSDLIVLKPDGGLRFLDLGSIVSREQRMCNCEYHFQRFLESISKRAEEKEIEARIRDFIKGIKNAFGNITI